MSRCHFNCCCHMTTLANESPGFPMDKTQYISKLGHLQVHLSQDKIITSFTGHTFLMPWGYKNMIFHN